MNYEYNKFYNYNVPGTLVFTMFNSTLILGMNDSGQIIGFQSLIGITHYKIRYESCDLRHNSFIWELRAVNVKFKK